MQNVVSAQPCVGKLGISLVLHFLGDQWCCGIKIKCFCFILTVIFHVQVEVNVEFTYLSVDGVE